MPPIIQEWSLTLASKKSLILHTFIHILLICYNCSTCETVSNRNKSCAKL